MAPIDPSGTAIVLSIVDDIRSKSIRYGSIEEQVLTCFTDDPESMTRFHMLQDPGDLGFLIVILDGMRQFRAEDRAGLVALEPMLQSIDKLGKSEHPDALRVLRELEKKIFPDGMVGLYMQDAIKQQETKNVRP